MVCLHSTFSKIPPPTSSPDTQSLLLKYPWLPHTHLHTTPAGCFLFLNSDWIYLDVINRCFLHLLKCVNILPCDGNERKAEKLATSFLPLILSLSVPREAWSLQRCVPCPRWSPSWSWMNNSKFCRHLWPCIFLYRTVFNPEENKLIPSSGIALSPFAH